MSDSEKWLQPWKGAVPRAEGRAAAQRGAVAKVGEGDQVSQAASA